MNLKVEPKKIDETYSTPIVQQTSFWSKVKRHLGLSSAAFDFSVKNSDIYTNVGGYSYTNGDLVLFYQYLNDEQYVAYCPYGPEIEPSSELQGRFLEELSESLKSYLPKGCMAIKYDLNWESHWVEETDFDEEGNWLGVPEKRFQEFNLNYNTCEWNLRKSNSNILPANTIMVDLSKDEEDILKSMKPKTRYNIRLALRKGVEVRIAGMKDLDIWYKLYSETAMRNGLHLNDAAYFKSMFLSKMENEDDEVKVKLLIAYHDNVPLAAMFLVLSHMRATYLYGASATEGRNMMPTYALQWKAMQLAKSAGCLDYDMFGIAPNDDPAHPMYGLYKFKKGFGGDIFHQLGCWDYPIDKSAYDDLLAYEMQMQGYYE